MKLTINIKPRIVKKTCKFDILNGTYTVSKYGMYHTNLVGGDNHVAVVANYIKYNRKTKQVRKNGKTHSTVIRRAHWVGYVYEIPTALLKQMNAAVVQGERSFKIVYTNKI